MYTKDGKLTPQGQRFVQDFLDGLDLVAWAYRVSPSRTGYLVGHLGREDLEGGLRALAFDSMRTYDPTRAAFGTYYWWRTWGWLTKLGRARHLTVRVGLKGDIQDRRLRCLGPDEIARVALTAQEREVIEARINKVPWGRIAVPSAKKVARQAIQKILVEYACD